MSRNEQILTRVQFDPRLKTYSLIVSSWTMLFTIIGIPLLVPWLLGLGQYVHRRQFESLEAELTDRSLNIRKGFLFRTQKNVPLDKITDLAVSEGPVLRHLGLCSLRVETAGGGANNAMGQAYLPGVIDALAFRDAVLEQRDRVTSGTVKLGAPLEESAGEGQAEVLREIHASLGRIEALLERGLSRES